MRVLIASPRKTGGAHLRCLLATTYGLNAAATRDAPAGTDVAAMDAWLAELPEHSVIGTSFPYSTDLARAARRHGVSLLAILRHPFDLFLSNHEVAQQRAARKKNTAEDVAFWNQFAGRELDDPALLDYARDGFATEIDWLLGWHESGHPTVRFEALTEDAAATLAALASHIGPRDQEAITRAIEQCPPDSPILSRPSRGRRMGDLPPGAWRERLPDTLQATLRQHFAAAAARLGYEVA